MARILKDLSRREIKEIAEEYANTPFCKSCEYFMDEYNISESTFYNVLHKAVLESIVSESTAKMIQNKAAGNSERHGGVNAKKRTLNTYEHLLNQRTGFRFKVSEGKKIVLKYISSEKPIEIFAYDNCVNLRLLKLALRDAVVFAWITNKQVKLLEEKTRKQKGEAMEEGFKKLLEKRKRYKEWKKSQKQK